jgi:hypothetical protein
MAHGYLGDGYGSHGEIDPDRGERDRDSDRRERNWRGERGWQGDRERGRGMMFGGSDRTDWQNRGSNWSDEDRWSDRGWRGGDSRWEGRQAYSANPDDHYRSWRDRHMSELDRDYADYCREREQQFHQDFDSWRQQRHANYQPLRTGMTQSGMSHDPEGGVQVATEGMADEGNTDAMGDATLGTNTTSSTRRSRG